MEQLKRQHGNFNIALMALIVVPEILAFAIIELMTKIPAFIGIVVTLMLVAQVINCSNLRYNSAKSIGENLPAGKGREAFFAYAASAKRCVVVVVVCWLVNYTTNFLLLAGSKLESFELLSLASWIIFAVSLLVMIVAARNTGKHLRNLTDVGFEFIAPPGR